MKCRHCQRDNPAEVKFCGGCGRPIRSGLTCSKCGHQNPLDVQFCHECGQPLAPGSQPPASPSIQAPSPQPTSFANGRYQVKKFLGEGGKKKVYLAHDIVLDRDVAFALIKTEKLDEAGRTRVKREAQSMARLDHPNIVSVLDFGDHEGQPFMVLPLLSGGDVEGLIKRAPEHKLAVDQAVSISKAVANGLVFAHAKGIIHRDIKPGNVWLSGDGIAKIGDFGLAVALDLSRLTQQGMMVGTVSYMPPEQAMGGEVTAKADLYSLGAMLYEMVTGHPPFIGDDSVAIIGQHINTPPVSPTWHRADLPLVMETLILQLLEKDPAKRPSTAADVLKVLDMLETARPQAAAAPPSVTSSSNPIYRRVFVGRETELKQLQSAFDGAMSGQGALMMVVGEPGIGKTATCEQLATYVALRGGKNLVGHCYEKGSLSLPYLGFVEALRGYVINRDSQELRRELGSGAGDVARIVSEIREKLKVKPKAGGNPDEERYRLMQAITSFLTHAASVQPMLLVLEDLHDADKGTIDLLTHVSRNLANSRLLIVGTYRDVEVDRTHPLSAALAELRRVSSYGRVLLRGLNADEVKRMLETIAAQEVPWTLAEVVHRQTEGNPLFVQEVVRYLNEEGLIKREGGRWKEKSGTQLAMSIPEGLRDVIGKRLSLLSKGCNQLLSVASVIGREFRLAVLQKVVSLSDEELFKTLEEAKKAAVIEERAGVGVSVSYRFAHAFFRQTLYEETIAPKRIRLHQQVARALEEIYASRLEEHAVEMAEHFSYSSDSEDLKKSVNYGEMAAKRASEVYAYGETVRLLEQAIKVQEILDPEDRAKRCDLLLALCDALYVVPDTRRILEVEAPAAFSLAESLVDRKRAVRACILPMLSIMSEQAAFATPEAAEWAKRIDRYARPETAERAYADMSLGSLMVWTGDRKSGLVLLNQAVDLARRVGDQQALWLATALRLWQFKSPQHIEQGMRLAEELWAGSHIGLNFTTIFALVWIGDIALITGRHKLAEEVWGELRAMDTRTGNTTYGLLVTAVDALVALMDGHLKDATDMEKSLQARGEEAGIPAVAYALNTSGHRARLYLGASPEVPERGIAHEILDRTSIPCLVQAHLGRKAAVAEILDKNVVQRPGIGTDEDERPIWVDVGYLESAVVTGHRPAAELLLKRLNVPELCISGFAIPTCVFRHLGGAAALLGRYEEARKHYLKAIRVCSEMPFRPELALSRLQLAELLFEHYPEEKAEALEHLDFAIQEFREMKMQPSLERALRQKKILKA